MSREVRRVPADWQHPKSGGFYKPLNPGEWFEQAVADWDEGNAKWSDGLREGYPEPWVPRDPSDGETYVEYAGERPTADEYMPNWSDLERTHWMMYESTSEGTPISPAFATPQELCRWLVDNKASAFADHAASYDAWWAVCQEGSTPGSAVLNVTTGEWTPSAEVMVQP